MQPPGKMAPREPAAKTELVWPHQGAGRSKGRAVSQGDVAKGDAAPRPPGPGGWHPPLARLEEPGRPVGAGQGIHGQAVGNRPQGLFSPPCPVPNVGINPSNHNIISPGPALPRNCSQAGGMHGDLRGISGGGDSSPSTCEVLPMKGLPRNMAKARRSQLLPHPRARRGFVLVDVLKAVVAPLPRFGGGRSVEQGAEGLGDPSGLPGMQQQQQQLAALRVGWVEALEPGCGPGGGGWFWSPSCKLGLRGAGLGAGVQGSDFLSPRDYPQAVTPSPGFQFFILQPSWNP